MKPRTPTPQEVEQVMFQRAQAGQEVPPEYEYVKTYGFNPSQARAEDGKWTSEGVVSAKAASHERASKKHAPHTEEYGAERLMGEGKKLLSKGKKSEAESSLLNAAKTASKTKNSEAAREGLSVLAEKHGMHKLGAYTGSVQGQFVPSRMKHGEDHDKYYGSNNTHRLSETTKNRSHYESDPKARKAYEAVSGAASSLTAVNDAIGRGDHKAAAKALDAAREAVKSKALTNPRTGETRESLSPHAKAAADYLHESIGFLGGKIKR